MTHTHIRILILLCALCAAHEIVYQNDAALALTEARQVAHE